MTIWPAMVAVTVELRPQHRRAMAKSLGARSEPTSGASMEWASPMSVTVVCPFRWKVAAARIRIEALTSSANISATVESQVANLSASRFSGRLSPKSRVWTMPEWR